MSDEPEIEKHYVPIEPDMEVLPPEKVIRLGVGMKTVLLLSILAAIAGAFGGAAISEAIRMKSASPVADVKSQIESVSTANRTLKNDVTQLETQIKTLSKQKPKELDAFESRLKKLEQTPALSDDANNYADFSARVEALEQSPARMRAEDADGEVSIDVMKRLEALEQQQSPVALNEIADRLDRLEVQNLNASKAASEVVVTGSRSNAAPIVILPPLPRIDILAAMTAEEKTSQSWVQRTFNRHVQVRETGELSPEQILDQVQSHLDNAEYRQALKTFDTLSLTARTTGKAWRDAIAAHLEATP